MKALSRMGVALALVLGLAAMTTVSAEEMTVKGTLACAKCQLKKADKCQDVLTVTDAQGASTEYWIVKNETAEKAGHLCSKTSPATVTGEVAEKDGKKWITASKIEKG